MTEARQRQYNKLNSIVKFCYLKDTKRSQILRHTELQDKGLTYCLSHLVSKGVVIKTGEKEKTRYRSNFAEYPMHIFDQHCIEMDKRAKNRKPRQPVVKVVEANQDAPKPTLADARYVHSMENYKDKYKEQAKHARENYVRKPVFVGNVWSQMV